MEVKYKLWIEKHGKYIFGEGTYRLLKELQTRKNLKKAAEVLGMSYRYAWGIIKKIEKTSNKKVTITHRGGYGKGKTTVTEWGTALIENFEKYNTVCKYYIQRPYILPAIAVDGLLFIQHKLLLIKRKNPPFKDFFALPGGFVEYGETLEQAISREFLEETGLQVKIVKLFNIYSDPHRDPRGHTISAVYYLKKESGAITSGDDAADIILVTPENVPKLAFDHNKIVHDFITQVTAY